MPCMQQTQKQNKSKRGHSPFKRTSQQMGADTTSHFKVRSSTRAFTMIRSPFVSRIGPPSRSPIMSIDPGSATSKESSSVPRASGGDRSFFAFFSPCQDRSLKNCPPLKLPLPPKERRPRTAPRSPNSPQACLQSSKDMKTSKTQSHKTVPAGKHKCMCLRSCFIACSAQLHH